MTASPDPDVHVALRLLGDLDPAEVTERLGLEPSSQFHAGEVVGNGPSGRVHQHSGWRLESTDAVAADTIEPHLEWLLEVIEPKAANLAALVADGISGSADCFWASAGIGGGPWISPESMTRLGALGFPLVISFYAVEPDRA